jgi:glycosyltransferase involved in cell wall biosynthesis
MFISIIIPVQIQHPVFRVYLENLSFVVDALFRCDFSGLEREIIVSDLGSSPFFKKKIDDICKHNNIIHLYNENQFMWNRSIAINTGLMAASGQRVFFIDADCIPPEDYFQKHVEVATDTNYVTNLVLDSDISAVKSSYYKELLKQKTTMRPCGWSQMSVPLDWFKNNTGFNEEYKLWGGEEDCLIIDMKKAGMQPCIIESHPIHLYHPPFVNLMAILGKYQECMDQIMVNQCRYFTHAQTLVEKNSNTPQIDLSVSTPETK